MMLALILSGWALGSFFVAALMGRAVGEKSAPPRPMSALGKNIA